MGTLVATGFMRGGKALEGAEQVGTAEMRRFWEAFLNGILERGKAKPGDKTVVDALLPRCPGAPAGRGGRNPRCRPRWGQPPQRPPAGLEATKAMVAQHGKAAAFQEKTRGLPDAGRHRRQHASRGVPGLCGRDLNHTQGQGAAP